MSQLLHPSNIVYSASEESEEDTRPKKTKGKSALKKKKDSYESDERQVQFNFRNCVRNF